VSTKTIDEVLLKKDAHVEKDGRGSQIKIDRFERKKSGKIDFSS
jgi:hypothetical protein